MTPAPAGEYQRRGKDANSAGASLLAFDIAEEGLRHYPGHAGLLQVKALALARLGSGQAARAVLQPLLDAGHRDEETLGLRARTFKDAWRDSGCRQDLEQAHRLYLEAYQQHPDRYWTGINAATLHLALHLHADRVLTGRILDACRALSGSDYWLPATMAEAHLLLGDVDQAAELYAEARRTAPLGDVLAMWRNVRIIDEVVGGVAARIEAALRPPKVALLKGAWPGTAGLDGVAVAYSPAASESDLAFLEQVQSMGCQTHIVLPYNEARFVAERLRGLEQRYREVKDRAHEAIVCADHPLLSANAGDAYARDVMRGLAQIRAAQMETALVEIGEEPPVETSPPPAGFQAHRRAMIFADAFHFSALAENQMQAFITHVMHRAAAVARNFRPQPEFKNTWGDGLFFVFESVAAAGRFALQLSEGVARVDRAAAGLPPEMALRIGAHAGPVYVFNDQIVDKKNYIGWHVNRAARIEPSATPGQVFVSEAFAALAALEAPGQFRFDYVGRRALAKNFGAAPLFALRSAG
jgi:class 3 adenylate cyclase/tetratricopeptide (TPR) repeat protein